VKAYLQFGGAFCGKAEGPFQTISANLKTTESPVNRNVTGYGRRIPTCYMVEHNGKWRRVYACSFGNWPTLYIGTSAEPIATVNITESNT